jgi:hypothetical protein
MTAGSSVIWTHCSVRYEVTWDKTLATARTRLCVRADIGVRPHLPAFHPRPRPCPPVPPCADGLMRPCGRSKKKKLFFFVFGICLLEKKGKKCSVFGFQSPRSTGFVGEATRRRRFFRPSSPSHPSKLYSSLGWLNSKVPKPFFPFTPRLIDVDGF